jgi:hypothetical protein
MEGANAQLFRFYYKLQTPKQIHKQLKVGPTYNCISIHREKVTFKSDYYLPILS